MFFCFQSGSLDDVPVSDSPESRSLSGGLLATGVGGVGAGAGVGGVRSGVGVWRSLSLSSGLLATVVDCV